MVDRFAFPAKDDEQTKFSSNGGPSPSKIDLVDLPGHAEGGTLLSLEAVTLRTPNGMRTLVEDLTLQVMAAKKRGQMSLYIYLDDLYYAKDVAWMP